MSAVEAFEKVVSCNEMIEKVIISFYKAPPNVQERIKMSTFEVKIINEALKTRKEMGIPFWESIFLTCLKKGQSNNALFDAALYHQGSGEDLEITRDKILKHELSKLLKRNSQYSIGLKSKVEIKSGEYRHLNFLDFHCEVSNTNAEIAIRICDRLISGGYVLLDSGDSYHAWGVQLVQHEERIRLLGRALFFMPIIDGFYIAHQLVQDSSSIRISGGGKRKRIPQVIAVHAAK